LSSSSISCGAEAENRETSCLTILGFCSTISRVFSMIEKILEIA